MMIPAAAVLAFFASKDRASWALFLLHEWGWELKAPDCPWFRGLPCPRYLLL